jgi:hypothetical protein
MAGQSLAGQSRPNDGVASLAYVPAIHALLCRQGLAARHKLALGLAKGRTRVAGHDVGLFPCKWEMLQSEMGLG